MVVFFVVVVLPFIYADFNIIAYAYIITILQNIAKNISNDLMIILICIILFELIIIL